MRFGIWIVRKGEVIDAEAKYSKSVVVGRGLWCVEEVVGKPT